MLVMIPKLDILGQITEPQKKWILANCTCIPVIAQCWATVVCGGPVLNEQ